MSDVDIVLEVATKGVENIYNLSNAMKQLNAAIAGVSNPIKNLDARSRALSAAVGAADSSLKSHAKTVSDLARNQVVLSNELGRVRKELAGMGTSYTAASAATSHFSAIGIKELKNYEKALKSIKFGALVEDLKSVAQEQKRLGKDAQFVGRSLIIGLTTPIMGFARYGLQALVGLDREFVRLNKVLESVAPNLDAAAQKMGVDLKGATDAQIKSLQGLVDNYNKLDKSLTGISSKFGTSKELVVSLAGEFAELGIQSTDGIAKITELTAATEKLGNMDIGNARQLVQSLYFQAVRAMQQSGESRNMSAVERETAAIGAAKAQLAMFNAIENTTALTLKDLGDAFPEVAAAATTFGLSMTEATAILAPMKAAGMDVGASANAIKISLQSIVSPTRKTEQMFASLTDQYGDHFKLIKGTGIDAIQSLIDAYESLSKSGAGQEGVLQFFTQVFGKRQGTRMLVGVQQLADFDSVLKDTTVSGERAEKQIQQIANTAIESANKATGANIPLVDSYKSIGIIARLATATAGQAVEGFSKNVSNAEIQAAIKVREQVSKGILDKGQREGIDLIGSVATESGRAMFVELAGVKNAQDVANRELDASLQSLEVTIQRMKNGFKLFAADLLTAIRPALEKVSGFVTKLYDAWTKLDPATKSAIAKITLGIATVTAAIGPLIFMFGQFRLAMGSVSKVIFGFLPGLKTMSVEMVAAKGAMLNLTKPLTVMGDTVVNTNGKFATFIATLASGDGPLATFAQKVGRVTGVLQKQTTAPIALTKAVTEITDTKKLADITGSGLFTGPSGITRPAPGTRARQFISTEQAFKDQTGLGVTRTGGIFSRPGGVFSRPGATGATFLPRSTLSLDDFNAVVNRRLDAMNAAGIRTGERGAEIGKRFFTPKFGGEVELSEERALRVARGGIRGRLEKTKIGGAGAISAAKETLTSLPSKAVTSYTSAITASKAATEALKIETLALTGQAPGRFAMMKASIMGFARSFKTVDGAIKLTKMTLIGSGIGIAILAIGVAVMLIKNNMDKFKEAGAKGLKIVGDAFNIVKNAALEIVRPIMDLFASFGDGSEGAGGAVSGLGKLFTGLATALKFVANIFSWLVKTIIQPYLYIVMNIVKFVISLFTGKWMDALKSLGAAFGGAFALIGKIVLNTMAFLVKQIINLIFELPSAFIKAWAWGVEKATDLFFGFAQFIVDQVKKIPVLGRFLGGAAQGALNLLKTGRDAYVGTIRTVSNAVNSAGDFIKRGIDSGVKKATDAMDKLGKGGIKKSTGKVDLGFGKKKTEEQELDVDTDPAQEKISNAVGDGITTGVDKGQEELNKLNTKLSKELKTELQNDIMDRIKTTMSDIVTSITETLKTQKENSLKIYDDQLKKIDETAKAEERLTKTKEYENKKRELEDKRALDRLNNQRNYNLAIYEGRIDDARTIALEGNKAELDAQKEMTDLETSRKKELADQRKEDLITSIKDARDIASKYYDDMIDSFTKAAKKITEFPPTTAEEFNTQLSSLSDKAKELAGNIGSKTSEGFTGALASLGVDSEGPLTSAMSAISKTLTDNNPFGEKGVWQTTIDASINGLKNKYIGLTNTLNTAVGESSAQFKELFDIYKNYKAIVAKNEAEMNGSTGTGSTTSGGGTPPGTGTGDAPYAPGYYYRSREKGQKDWSPWIGPRKIAEINAIKPILSKTGFFEYEFNQHNPWYDVRRGQGNATSSNTALARAIGGTIPFAQGGPTHGPIQQGIPAILHGGEYVVRNSAVKKYGWGMMQQINQGTFKPKPFAVGGMIDRRRVQYTDPAAKEWAWQQQQGAMTAPYLEAMGMTETGDAWKGKAANWFGRSTSSHGKMGGGLNIEDRAWQAYGGREFAKTADKASKLAQMVIKNRIFLFGYTDGKRLLTPTGLAGSVFDPEITKFGSPLLPRPEDFNPNIDVLSQISKIKKDYTTAGSGSGWSTPEGEAFFKKYFSKKGGKPKGVDRILMPGMDPIWVKHGKNIAPHIVNAPEGFFKGGIVDESKKILGGNIGLTNIKPSKKKGGVWNFLDKTVGSAVNFGMDKAAGGIDWFGHTVYSGLESMAASTTNPLGKALHLPGFKNARVAGPLETAFNAAFLALDFASAGGAEPLREAALVSMGIRGAEKDAIMMAPKVAMPKIIKSEVVPGTRYTMSELRRLGMSRSDARINQIISDAQAGRLFDKKGAETLQDDFFDKGLKGFLLYDDKNIFGMPKSTLGRSEERRISGMTASEYRKWNRDRALNGILRMHDMVDAYLQGVAEHGQAEWDRILREMNPEDYIRLKSPGFRQNMIDEQFMYDMFGPNQEKSIENFLKLIDKYNATGIVGRESTDPNLSMLERFWTETLVPESPEVVNFTNSTEALKKWYAENIDDLANMYFRNAAKNGVKETPRLRSKWKTTFYNRFVEPLSGLRTIRIGRIIPFANGGIVDESRKGKKGLLNLKPMTKLQQAIANPAAFAASAKTPLVPMDAAWMAKVEKERKQFDDSKFNKFAIGALKWTPLQGIAAGFSAITGRDPNAPASGPGSEKRLGVGARIGAGIEAATWLFGPAIMEKVGAKFAQTAGWKAAKGLIGKVTKPIFKPIGNQIAKIGETKIGKSITGMLTRKAEDYITPELAQAGENYWLKKDMGLFIDRVKTPIGAIPGRAVAKVKPTIGQEMKGRLDNLSELLNPTNKLENVESVIANVGENISNVGEKVGTSIGKPSIGATVIQERTAAAKDVQAEIAERVRENVRTSQRVRARRDSIYVAGTRDFVQGRELQGKEKARFIEAVRKLVYKVRNLESTPALDEWGQPTNQFQILLAALDDLSGPNPVLYENISNRLDPRWWRKGMDFTELSTEHLTVDEVMANVFNSSAIDHIMREISLAHEIPGYKQLLKDLGLDLSNVNFPKSATNRNKFFAYNSVNKDQDYLTGFNKMIQGSSIDNIEVFTGRPSVHDYYYRTASSPSSFGNDFSKPNGWQSYLQAEKASENYIKTAKKIRESVATQRTIRDARNNIGWNQWIEADKKLEGLKPLFDLKKKYPQYSEIIDRVISRKTTNILDKNPYTLHNRWQMFHLTNDEIDRMLPSLPTLFNQLMDEWGIVSTNRFGQWIDPEGLSLADFMAILTKKRARTITNLMMDDSSLSGGTIGLTTFREVAELSDEFKKAININDFNSLLDPNSPRIPLLQTSTGSAYYGKDPASNLVNSLSVSSLFAPGYNNAKNKTTSLGTGEVMRGATLFNDVQTVIGQVLSLILNPEFKTISSSSTSPYSSHLAAQLTEMLRKGGWTNVEPFQRQMANTIGFYDNNLNDALSNAINNGQIAGFAVKNALAGLHGLDYHDVNDNMANSFIKRLFGFNLTEEESNYLKGIGSTNFFEYDPRYIDYLKRGGLKGIVTEPRTGGVVRKPLIEQIKGASTEFKKDIYSFYNHLRSGKYENGGIIPKAFANGGIVPNFDSMAVPAILHGGEYVVNSKAVKNIGFAALEAMNNMRFQTPKAPSYSGPVSGQTASSSTVHIYVDNFIGEKAWFESMMKDYNINVSPQNQKAAGLQNRTISTYNGINRGL